MNDAPDRRTGLPKPPSGPARATQKQPTDPIETEARHREVTEGASDWIWETNVENRLTFVSKRFGDTSGIPWSQVNGRWVGDLVPLGFERAGMDTMLAQINARVPYQTVYRVDPADGTTRFWRLTGKPFFDPETGAFAGYRGTGTDITAAIGREAALQAALLRAEKAEREAQQAKQRLVDAIEAIQEGFVLHDAEDRLVLCNKRYGEIYGLTPENMQPGVRYQDTLRDISRTVYLDDDNGLEAFVAERLQQHRNADGNHSYQKLTSGRWMLVEERRTSDGGTVGIRVDVTEARRQAALERERERAMVELQAARLMQTSLLPSVRLQKELTAKTGLEIASHYASCTELGGDLWGLSDLDQGRIGVYTLDVTGHGTAAALNTFRLHTLIHELGAWLLDPARFLQELNLRLAELLQPGAFATMFYGIVDPSADRITYATAGSPPPLIRCATGLPLMSLNSSGVPLGITARADYPCANVTFASGGMLFLYSDILTDHADENGNRAGEEGAFAHIQSCADEPTAEAAVQRICAPFFDPPGKSLSDDLTVVCIRRR